MEINQKLGQALRKQRESKEFSQLELANRAKITQAYYSAIENGQHRISFTKLLHILEVLGFDNEKVIDRMFSEN